MKIFLTDHENLLPLRAFIPRKMFLTLNFIIGCLCNLDCLANSLFALISIFKVLSGVKFPGPGLQHLLSFQPGLIQGIHTVYPRIISHWSWKTHLTLFRFMPSAWRVSSSCYLKALRVLLSVILWTLLGQSPFLLWDRFSVSSSYSRVSLHLQADYPS